MSFIDLLNSRSFKQENRQAGGKADGATRQRFTISHY